MTPVLDASLLVALATSEPAGALVEEPGHPIADDEEIHAPVLVYYEVASGLRKAIRGGRMRLEQMRPLLAPCRAMRSDGSIENTAVAGILGSDSRQMHDYDAARR